MTESVKKRKKSITAKYILFFSLLLLAANIVLGIVMYNFSRYTVRDLVWKDMLSVSNTAAGLMDGDQLATFTQNDVGSNSWEKVVDDLRVFQNNIDIKYIYTVRELSSGKFVFVVDPDPVNPGEIGEEIVVTPALISASQGEASVDSEPMEDEWGNFYSSYSPVFGSDGKVAAIVGVDFDAAWYEAQVREHMLPALYIIIGFLIVYIIILFIFSRKMLKRVTLLNSQLSELTVNVDGLIRDLSSDLSVYDSNEKTPALTTEELEGDELSILSDRLREMQEELKRYQTVSQRRAITDALTGIKNTMAYTETQESLNKQIQEGKAAFGVAMFDLNYLKRINDNYGHAAGDVVIRAAGRSISDVFGYEGAFRIGGDEFLVVDEKLSAENIEEKLELLDQEVKAFNDKWEMGELSISTGYSFFEPETDTSFHDVFVKADEAMYRHKQEFHERAALKKNTGSEEESESLG